MAAVLVPTSVEEIAAAVRAHPGPISIGGARYSMGGQVAAPDSLHLDMRSFNRVVTYSAAERWITVQAGIRWRAILELIDRDDLAVAIMQSYANFTVGGSLSVNAHGRYVGRGPIIQSVRRIQLVLADGSIREASRDLNAELFHGAIGGYGGLGVITEVTLGLVPNSRVRRSDEVMTTDAYPRHFERDVRPDAVLHNADLYPPGYDTLRAVTYRATDQPLTSSTRLRPPDRPVWDDRLAYWVISEVPGGKRIRQLLIDRWLFAGNPVTWRNYEASYDVSELEPASRQRSTYLLQEYFVPAPRFDDFVPRLGRILRQHDVNVLNVSVRHATSDPGSLLAWAREDVFAFVIYYKQSTGSAAEERARVWAGALIEAALDCGGTYYLPYRLLASRDQFRRGYPRADEYFALKQRVDPTGKFQNQLLVAYGPG